MVGPANTPSQPWLTMAGNPLADGGTPATQTMYFSFDTPVNGEATDAGETDGGPPTYCGRAVYSDLHLGSNAQSTPDIPSLDTSNDVMATNEPCGGVTNPPCGGMGQPACIREPDCIFAAAGQPPPMGCAANSTDGGPGIDLSPQEKALEFMIFDLSSCVISDKITPPKTVPIIY